MCSFSFMVFVCRKLHFKTAIFNLRFSFVFLELVKLKSYLTDTGTMIHPNKNMNSNFVMETQKCSLMELNISSNQ